MYGFIYITINHINGKKYIGQKKYDKSGKWKDYLGSGIYLKREINKYGKENFSKEIIEECISKEQLDEREIYWISYYNAVESDEFYNIAYGGDGGNTISGYNKNQKQELSNKLSKIRKGNINLGSLNGNSREVICLNNMEIFDCIANASKQTGIKEYSIQQCCSEKSRVKTAGYINGERGIWEYYDKNKTYKYVKFKREYKEKYYPVYCITTKETFNNAEVAGKKYNINSSSIRSCCNERLLSAGKLTDGTPLIWCDLKDIDKIDDKTRKKKESDGFVNKRLRCINTNVIFDSVKDAFKWLNAKDYYNLKHKLKEDGFYHYKRHPITGEKLLWEILD